MSGVGDDGLGRFLVRALGSEGIDTSWIVVHPTLRTALAFCELWPPDRFPLTLYRRPTCPDQQLQPSDIPLDHIRAAPLVYVSGTALANEPSRSAAHAALDARRESLAGHVATILDLDWRPNRGTDPTSIPLRWPPPSRASIPSSAARPSSGPRVSRRRTCSAAGSATSS